MKHKTDVSFNKTDCLFITLTICQWLGKVLPLFLLCCKLERGTNDVCGKRSFVLVIKSSQSMLSVNVQSYNEVQAKHHELNSDDVWIPQGNSKSSLNIINKFGYFMLNDV